MAPKWTQRPKGGVLRHVLRKPVTKDEASRQSRSVKKRPAASKPNYVPEHQKLDSETAQLKDVIWMNTEVVLEDLLKMSEKQLLQTLYKSKHLLKPSACPHCGKESLSKLAFLRNKWQYRCYATKCKKHVLPVSTSSVGGIRGAIGNVVRRVQGLEARAGYLCE